MTTKKKQKKPIKQPKISVVVFSYNFEKYIGECIQSLVNQTLKPYEIIICDDHSTDGSWDIIEKFKSKFPNLIKIHRHPQNIGHIKNGKFGKDQAKGTHVSIIDGDDRWLPDKLEKEWQALLANPKAKVAYSNVIIVDEKGMKKSTWSDEQDPEPPSGDVFAQVFGKRFFERQRSLFRNQLMDRKAMIEAGYDAGKIPIHADWNLKIRLAAKYEVAYSGEALVEYRDHPGGIHHTARHNIYESTKYVIEKNKYLLEKRSPEEQKYILENLQSLLYQEYAYSQNSATAKKNEPVTVESIKPSSGNNRGENLIFLISQPRAGSTLLQRMLGANEKIHTIAEPWVMLHPVYALRNQGIATEYGANYALQALDDFMNSMPDLSEDYFEAIRKMGLHLYDSVLKNTGKDIFLDKTPRYYFIIKELYHLFPDAKFVFLLRNPLSVLSSILNSFVSKNWDILSLHRADLLKAPKLLIDGIKHLGKDAVIANYESIVSDPENQLRALCKSLNIKYSSKMLKYGNFAAPPGRMGDQIGIKQHSGPVNDKVDKWIDDLDSPEGKLLTETYISFLGADVFSELGYDYSELQEKAAGIKSDWKKLPDKQINLVLDRFGIEADNVLNQSQFLNTPKETQHSGYTVSAIVSTYNSEQFISNCLEDLTAQTLYEKGGLEIIIVNSGSEQNEDAIITEYIKTHNHIKYIKTEQRETIYQAWNRAIKMAKGKYLTNANTDDRHRKDSFAFLADVLDREPDIALVYGNQIITETKNQTFDKHTAVDYLIWPDYDRNYLLKVCSTGSQPMWRQSLHDDHGYFDETLQIAGDYEFWLRISQSNRFKQVNELLGLYYRSSANAEYRNPRQTQQETAVVQSYYRNKVQVTEPQIKDNPLVSVIVPTYNRPQQLMTALKSVAAQTYKNIEAVVVNDGGQDVANLIEELKEDLQINYITYKKNKDRAAARNIGLKSANGAYIAYLDDDDMYHSDHIETALKILTNSDFKIVYTDAFRTFQKKINTGYGVVRRDIPYSHDFQPGIFLQTNITPTLCVVHEKKIIDEIGGFDETLPVLEDWDLWIRMSQKYNFYHIKKVTCEFTWRDDGSTTTSSKLDQFAKYRQQIAEKYLSQRTEKELSDSREPVSIIMLTYNALEYTKKCIQSIQKHTKYPHEIIIVDNGSKDGTRKYLRELDKNFENIQIKLNQKNKGFSGGNNQGAKIAKGKYVYFLNNDVLVSDSWLESMVNALEADEKIGMVGPLTNSISGLQMVTNIPYKDDKGFLEYAAKVRRIYSGKFTPRRRIAGFAFIMEKELYEKIGGFDESYGTGNFEDDDLCLRVRQEGYAIMVDESTYIHHYGSQTFKANDIDILQSLDEKGKIFKEKWPDVDYEELLEMKNPLSQSHVKKMQKAAELISKAEYHSTREEYKSILSDHPLHTEALLGTALCSNSLQEFSTALTFLNKLLKLEPQNVHALNQAGMALAGNGELESAKSSFALAVEKNPELIDAQRNYGDVLIETGEFEAGITVFQTILKNHPDDIPSLLYMSDIYLETGRLEEATDFINKVLQLDKGNELALQLRSVIESSEQSEDTNSVVSVQTEEVETTTAASQMFCITGMHRSGTSLLAHLLYANGVNLGDEERLMKATEDNPQGYWENTEIVKINEALLSSFGLGWDHIQPLPEGWLNDEKIARLKSLAGQLLDTSKDQSGLAWKDPRASITYPFWKSLEPDLKVVILYRNPLEVAHSLVRRNRMSIPHSMHLWHIYNQTIIGQTSEAERIFVNFDRLMANPGSEIKRVLEWLGIPVDETLLRKSASLVKQDLKHHSAQDWQKFRDENNDYIFQLYEELNTVSGNEPDITGGSPVSQLTEDDQRITDANEMLSAGDAQSALAAYYSILNDYPDLVDALLGAAICCNYLGDYEKALLHLNQLLQLEPENAMAYNQSGLALVGMQDFESALPAFELAVQKNPQLVDAQRNYGGALIESGDFENGVRIFQAILEKHPDDVPALLYMTQLNYEAGRLSDADIYIQLVLKVDPENEIALKFKSILENSEPVRD